MLKVVVQLFLTSLLMADGPVLKTGQTKVYKAGDDGTYQAGTARSYTRSAAGVVSDNATGLQWQDDIVSSTMSRADAATYCTNLALDGGGWRLPALQALRTLVVRNRSMPSIDPIFHNVASGDYWSSTAHAASASTTWFVGFEYGGSGFLYGPASLYVRCVRGGQN